MVRPVWLTMVVLSGQRTFGVGADQRRKKRIENFSTPCPPMVNCKWLKQGTLYEQKAH